MIRTIAKDSEFLRTKCEDVASNEEASAIIAQLEEELKHSEALGRPGTGLAAVQIGIPKHAAIIRINEQLKVDLINCRITQGYDQKIFHDEGCLSIPGESFDTKRYEEIVVAGNLLPPHSFVATGLFAVAVQHELDHCNGILVADIAIPKRMDMPKLGPNERCFCGSGIKFKKCHGK